MPAFEAPEPGSVTFEGWLYKKGGVNPAFKRRWFRVSGGHLFYFFDQWTAHPKGAIALGGARVAALAQPVGRHDYCFLLACAPPPLEPHGAGTATFAVPFPPGRGSQPEYVLCLLYTSPSPRD